MKIKKERVKQKLHEQIIENIITNNTNQSVTPIHSSTNRSNILQRAARVQKLSS